MKNYLKKILKKITVLCSLLFIFSFNCIAAKSIYTDSFEEYGIDYIELDSDYYVITRNGIYNTETEGEKADSEALQERMTNTNTYICAIPSSRQYEINVDFMKQDEYFDISLMKDFSTDEIMSIFDQDFPNGTKFTSAQYKVKSGNVPTIEVEAQIADLDQYMYGYTCSAKGTNGYYTIFYKLYTYGRKPSETEKQELSNIINSSKINVDSNSGMSEDVATKKVITEMAGETLYKALTGAISGGLLVGIILLWKKITSKNKKEKSKKEDDEGNPIAKAAEETRIDVNTNIESQILDKEIKTSIDILNKGDENGTAIKKEDESTSVPEKKEAMSDSESHLYCRKCGRELPLDSLFCNKCGTKVIKI